MFFQQHLGAVKSVCDKLIVVGDFNTVINVHLDRNINSKHNNDKSTKKLHELMEEMMLTDVWRDRNPEIRRYSWYRMKPVKTASRLDYALVSTGLSGIIHDTFYLNGVRTDHSAFFIGLEFNHVERGRGF